MIPFNKPVYTKNVEKHVLKALKSNKISGDSTYTLKCHQWFESKLNTKKALLTPNCTQALEMAAVLIEIKPGDEVIMPSYTFVSTANAFALRGATIVFVDIDPLTMNMDVDCIEGAITNKTKAIVPVHYAGISCDMNKVMHIAKKYNLYVIEDAAQAVMSKFEEKDLGTIGHFGAYSFHETKNYTSGGEGGLLLINDERFVQRAEIIREKGTNRSLFFRGMVDKYSWVDIGSSYLPSDIQAAHLFGQLEQAEEINDFRLDIWNCYYKLLEPLEIQGYIERPNIPHYSTFNAHMFYIKLDSIELRQKLMKFLSENKVMAVFHYIPLHSSKAGLKYSRFSGNDLYTTKESERLLRLPLFYSMEYVEVERVVALINKFFDE